MIKNIINTLIVFLFLGLLVLVFLERNVVFESVSYSLKIWTTTLIPTMFPFFVISDILISYHITQYIPSFIKNVFSCYKMGFLIFFIIRNCLNFQGICNLDNLWYYCCLKVPKAEATKCLCLLQDLCRLHLKAPKVKIHIKYLVTLFPPFLQNILNKAKKE